MPDLQFTPDDHKYLADGRELPSVTRILTAVGLYKDWEKFGLEPRYKFRGHAVHKACQHHEIVTGMHPEIQPYFNQFVECKKALGFVPRVWELPLYDLRRNYAGTPDLLAECRDEIWLIDLKSGSVPKRVGAQLCGYEDLFFNGEFADRPGLDKDWIAWARQNRGKFRRKSIQLGTGAGPGKVRQYDGNEPMVDWRSSLRIYQIWVEDGRS